MKTSNFMSGAPKSKGAAKARPVATYRWARRQMAKMIYREARKAGLRA